VLEVLTVMQVFKQVGRPGGLASPINHELFGPLLGSKLVWGGGGGGRGGVASRSLLAVLGHGSDLHFPIAQTPPSPPPTFEVTPSLASLVLQTVRVGDPAGSWRLGGFRDPKVFAIACLYQAFLRPELLKSGEVKGSPSKTAFCPPLEPLWAVRRTAVFRAFTFWGSLPFQSLKSRPLSAVETVPRLTG